MSKFRLKRSTIILAFVCIAVPATASAFRSLFNSTDERYATQSEAPNTARYARELSLAISAREKGDLVTAIMNFSAAASEPFAESPNYELWPDLAELYCASGKRVVGRELAQEYACAVDVMAGRKICWSDVTSSLRVPNPRISPLCYATVCSAEFEQYFGQSAANPQLLKRDIRDRRIARAVSKRCES